MFVMPIPILIQRRQKTKEELELEIDYSNHLNFIELKKLTNYELKELNKSLGTNYSLSEAILAGYSFHYLTRKHLEQIIEEVRTT